MEIRTHDGTLNQDYPPAYYSSERVDVYVTDYLHYALTVNNNKNIEDGDNPFFGRKHAKKMKISVDWWLITKHDILMPSQRKIDKKQISVWIPIVLFRKFQKRAQGLGMTMTEIITAYLVQQTQNINLTPEDYENIAREIRKKANNR